jgi:hypothetical protein
MKSLLFQFEAYSPDALVKHLYLLFEDVTFSNFKLIFKKEDSTVDSLYRGRFEKDGTLFEYLPTGEAYFYIDFVEGNAFEFFSSRACLIDKDGLTGQGNTVTLR